MKLDTFSRFSSKAENYAKYRPDYASEAILAIFTHTQLMPTWTIADIGSGTGIVSRHFIKNRNMIYAVEPNSQMRQTAEKCLGKYPSFLSVDGSSQATMLPDKSIDLITVGQAIRWFDGEPTQREFARILKPIGWLAILQHARPNDDMRWTLNHIVTADNGWTPEEYLNHQIRPFEWWFDEKELIHLQFPNPHTFDQEGLIGLQLSNSHAPDESHPKFSTYVLALEKVFDKFQTESKVTLDFTTHLYLGQIR